MKLCYCDESGTGDEPIAVMAGVLVDCHRMHITKAEWGGLLEYISGLADRAVSEFHTRDFYAGNGIWRGVEAGTRVAVISAICEWLAERKHHVVYTSVCKATYYQQKALQFIPDELNTVWRFMGFHLVLAIQKHCQREKSNKGHTILVFDNEEREHMRFTDIITHPRAWSEEYYGKKNKQAPLDQIVDVPYFGDSVEVGLIQLADFIAFFLRRYAEIKENLVGPKYADEENRIQGWIDQIAGRSIGSNFIYPKRGRGNAEELFFRNASQSIREI
jgi:hypothetical protein